MIDGRALIRLTLRGLNGLLLHHRLTLLLNVPLRFRLLSLLRRLGLYHSSLLSALTSSLFELS